MAFNVGGAASGAAMGTQIMPGWGTAIGAVAGGLLGGSGGSDGYKAPMKLARRTTKENIGMYEDENDRLGGYYNPYIESGRYANTQIGNMLGQNGQEAADAAWNQSLSPGARFLEQQQNAALLRNKAALGDVGGNQLAALANQSNLFNFGQAQTYMGNLQNQQALGANMLGNYSQLRGGNIDRMAQARNNLVNIKAGASIAQANQRNAEMTNNMQGLGALGGMTANLFNKNSGGGASFDLGGQDPNRYAF